MEAKKIELVGIDLDGTLLNDLREPTPYSVSVLNEAIQKGVEVVPVTGRNYQGITCILERVPGIRYAILMNGARTIRLPGPETIRKADIMPEEAEEVFDYLDQLPVLYDVFQDGETLTSIEHYQRFHEFCPNPDRAIKIRSSKRPLENFREEMRKRNRPCQKIQPVFRSQEDRDTWEEEIRRRFPDLSVSFSLPINLEMTAVHANKGDALIALCSLLGIDPKNAMAIGDSKNDISMFHAVGISVAMGNALEIVKENATEVTQGNDQDGAAKALKRYLND